VLQRHRGERARLPSTGDGNAHHGASVIDLGALGFNGGFTETMVPQSGSAAICGGTTAAH